MQKLEAKVGNDKTFRIVSLTTMIVMAMLSNELVKIMFGDSDNDNGNV